MPPSRRDLLAVASAAGTGALAGCAGLLGSVEVETHAGSADWPLRYHDTRNTGYNPEANGLRDAPVEQWRVRLFDADDEAFGGYSFDPAPVAVGDRVYVGGDTLSAHRVEDGSEVWSADDESAYYGVAATGDVLTALASSAPPTESALLRHRFDGTRQWREPIPTTRPGGPLVAADRVYVADADRLHALDARGDLLWSVEGNLTGTLPAADESTLYAATRYDDGVAARDHRRGLLRRLGGGSPDAGWTASVASYLASPPAVGDARIFAPGGVEWYPGGSDDTTGAELVAVERDGNRAWTDAAGSIVATPAVGPDGVYVRSGIHTETVDVGEHVEGRFDARVAAYDSGGERRWTRRFPDLGSWHVPPVLADGTLYVTLHDSVGGESRLRAVGADDGTVLWDRALDAPAYHLAAVGDTLLVTTADGVLHALG